MRIRGSWTVRLWFATGWLAVALLSPATWAQAGQTTKTIALPVDKNVEVAPSPNWVDTGIDLHPGDALEISATTTGGGNSPCDPQGLPDLGNAGKLPLGTALPGALIAKLQEKAPAPVFVGPNRQLKITEAGRLYLGSNVGGAVSCAGKYSVKIHVVPGAGNEAVSIKSKLASAAQIWLSGQLGGSKPETAQNPGMASDANLGSTTAPASGMAAAGAAGKTLAVSRAPLDAALRKDLQALPRRVNDEFKNLGDMVNFVLIGSEKQVQGALAAANWHVADTSTPDAVARAIMMATQKKDYLQMPMSQLYLFGRVQDFGYEMAEPASLSSMEIDGDLQGATGVGGRGHARYRIRERPAQRESHAQDRSGGGWRARQHRRVAGEGGSGEDDELLHAVGSGRGVEERDRRRVPLGRKSAGDISAVGGGAVRRLSVGVQAFSAGTQVQCLNHCSLAYSALASLSRGTSGSASFQAARKF
jgi:LssY C-terminus